MPSESGHRLYVKGRHLSYQRSRHVTHPSTSLIKIEGVDNTDAANFYLGKKIAYVYRAQKEIRGSKIRVIWGKVTRPHGIFSSRAPANHDNPLTYRPGNSGVVRAKFSSPLPTKSFGASVRVMLYPSSI
ncbi:60S ribosomal protein L33-A [Tolypocladium ophioglossoides CBS 100239]|uniref:60S ribosomal protein L33-A n=1 Tax=Tolypocladium ophioglossoides (strain CBS 100239) TaxID=1163406 RepID=A0A0L0N494_TOLOC|nr:60S ribosomal protein L33-A [Tolypocladium ophioglossoides CBS 100239]